MYNWDASAMTLHLVHPNNNNVIMVCVCVCVCARVLEHFCPGIEPEMMHSI